jgi:hypothetical protein
MSKADLFGNKHSIPFNKIAGVRTVELTSDDEVILRVEE